MHPILGIISILLTIGITLTVHELAHAYEMKRQGVTIARIGIGISWPKQLCFTFQDKWFFNCPVTLSPLLLAAYVKPVENEVFKSLTDEQDIIISASGPWSNYFLFIILFALYAGIVYQFNDILLWPFGIAILTVISKRFFSYVLFPISSVLLVIVILYLSGIAILSDFGTIMSGDGFTETAMGKPAITEVFGGPVLIYQIAKQYASSFVDVLFFGALISLSIGMMNNLPLYPLDGGRVMGVLLGKQSIKLRTVFQNSSFAVLVAIILIILLVDVFSVFI